MTIEILIYPALSFLAVTMIAKLIERRRDVLYGPYIQGRKTDLARLRDQFDAVMTAIGVKHKYGRVAVKFISASIATPAIAG